MSDNASSLGTSVPTDAKTTVPKGRYYSTPTKTPVNRDQRRPKTFWPYPGVYSPCVERYSQGLHMMCDQILKGVLGAIEVLSEALAIESVHMVFSRFAAIGMATPIVRAIGTGFGNT